MSQIAFPEELYDLMLMSIDNGWGDLPNDLCDEDENILLRKCEVAEVAFLIPAGVSSHATVLLLDLTTYRLHTAALGGGLEVVNISQD